jgi:hypothetical protein
MQGAVHLHCGGGEPRQRPPFFGVCADASEHWRASISVSFRFCVLIAHFRAEIGGSRVNVRKAELPGWPVMAAAPCGVGRVSRQGYCVGVHWWGISFWGWAVGKGWRWEESCRDTVPHLPAESGHWKRTMADISGRMRSWVLEIPASGRRRGFLTPYPSSERTRRDCASLVLSLGGEGSLRRIAAVECQRRAALEDVGIGASGRPPDAPADCQRRRDVDGSPLELW